MTALYSDIIRRAWRIIWQNKALWFFGLFLVLIGQEVEIILRNYYAYVDQTLSLSSWRELFQSGYGGAYADLWSAITQTTIGAVVFLLLALIIIVFVVWLTLVSVGGLISSVVQIENDKPQTFGNAFAVGQKYFGRNLVIYLAAKIFDYTFLIIVGLVTSLVAAGVVKVVLGVVMVCLSIVVSLLISFVAKYAACYVVIRNQPVADAIRSGWRLFIKNLVDSLEMALIIFAINLIVTLILFLAIILIIVPFLLLSMIVSQGSVPGLSDVLLYLLTVIVVIILIVVGSALSAFQFSAWTIFFLRLEKGLHSSFLIRWFQRLTGRKKAAAV